MKLEDIIERHSTWIDLNGTHVYCRCGAKVKVEGTLTHTYAKHLTEVFDVAIVYLLDIAEGLPLDEAEERFLLGAQK